MDNLAHTLCGAALARSRLVPRAPLVTATLVLAANGPDVDALLYVVGDPIDALMHRRGWTHSLSTFLVQIPLFALVMRGVGRWWAGRKGDAEPIGYRPLLLASAAGYLSHLLLDLLNTYGVRFLLPFTDRWFRGDSAFIVDPWMWWLFGSAVLFGGGVTRLSYGAWFALTALGSWGMTTRGVPVGVLGTWAAIMCTTAALRFVRGPRVAWARACVALLLLHLVLLKSGSVVARARGLAAVARDGVLPAEVASTVNPAPAVPWRSTVVVALPEQLYRVRVSLFAPRANDEVFWSHRRNLDDPALAVHEHTREMRAWRRFARHPFVVRDGGQLILADGRYSYGSASSWASFVLPLEP